MVCNSKQGVVNLCPEETDAGNQMPDWKWYHKPGLTEISAQDRADIFTMTYQKLMIPFATR